MTRGREARGFAPNTACAPNTPNACYPAMCVIGEAGVRLVVQEYADRAAASTVRAALAISAPVSTT